jgi:uncharacterized membrane protein
MKPLPKIRTTPVRCLVAAVWILFCLVAIGAPIAASKGYFIPSALLYSVFSGLCHQIPERSFVIAGFPFAVCHRCFGVYLGLALGSFLNIPIGSPRCRRVWALAATAPLLVDVALSRAGFGGGTPGIRFLTGLLFGTMLCSLLIRGIEELIEEAPWRKVPCKGGIE